MANQQKVLPEPQIGQLPHGITASFPDDVVLEVRNPRHEHNGLWARVTSTVNGRLIHDTNIDFLNQRSLVDYHSVAATLDGRVNWLSYLLVTIKPVEAFLEENSTSPESSSIEDDPWPKLDTKAYHGLAGILTIAIDPYTEADPFAVLLNILTAFGNLVGHGPHFRVEHTRHDLRIFVALVGETAKGRKGLSWSTPRHVFAAIDEPWVTACVTSGLSSGEGVIYAVRDERWEKQPIRVKGRVVDYQRVLVDEGVADKRLLLVEEEFAQALKVMAREGNILSPILRQAWDSGTLRPLVKNNPIRATHAHISIIAHITKPELLRYLDAIEMSNGAANRFLWAMVRRSKKIASPTGTPDSVLNPLVTRLHAAAQTAKTLGEMRRDPDAETLWEALYDELSEGQLGLFGAITARAEAQVMRLAAIYAALDSMALIQVPHLQAALAVWRYCEASARYIFGDSTGDAVADRILTALQEQGPMDRTAIRDLFGRHLPTERIDRALATLKQTRRITIEQIKNTRGGRPLTVVRLTETR